MGYLRQSSTPRVIAGSPKSSHLSQLKKSTLAAFLAVGVASCGGEDENKANSASTPVPTPNTPEVVVPTPISDIPTYATAIAELGPISGGSVVFKRLDGQIIASGGSTNSEGMFSYNPRSVIAGMGSDSLVIVEIGGGSDTDADDDGIRDANATPIKGSFRVAIPRSHIEKAKSFVAGPGAALATETVIATNQAVTLALLDVSAQSAQVQDENGDGQISYDDMTTKQAKDIDGASRARVFGSGFPASIHAGDETAKKEAVSWNVERQNTLKPYITLDFENTQNHQPVLSLRSSSANATILYTLDGTIPTTESSTTHRAANQLNIGMQDAKLLYREVYSINGSQVLGGVESFDLLADFFMLGQAISIDQHRPVVSDTIRETHQGVSYFIKLNTLYPEDGTGYPLAIDCESDSYPDYGCDRAPYIAYTQEQKERFVSLIRKDIQGDIDSGYLTKATDPVKPEEPDTPAPTHTPSEQVVYQDKTDYLGGWYRLTHTYNLDGKSDFPVKITGSYAIPNKGRQDNIETLIYQASDLKAASDTIIDEMKMIIKTEHDKIPKPTYPQNTEIKESGEYRGGSYTLVTVMNINGDMDYPARVYVEYTLPDGTKKMTTRFIANDAAELRQVQIDTVASAKSVIDLTLDDRYPTGHVELNQGITYDRGGSYKVETHYSFIPGKDYPGYVVIDFTLPNGVSDRWTREVETEHFRDAAILQGVEWVQDQITLAIPTEPVKPLPIYPQNHRIEHTPRTAYLGAWYSLTQIFNLNGDADYPVQIIGSYSLPNAERQQNKEGFADTIEELAEKTQQILNDIMRAIREAFDALPKPTYPQNTQLTEYGSHRGYSYTLTTVMNISGTSDYPAKVYVDYTLPNGQTDRTTAMHANDAQELQQVKAERLENVRAKLNQLLDDIYAPGYREVIQSRTYENGGSYEIVFEYAYNQGKDYPGYILIDYTLPDGTSSNWSYPADNAQEKSIMTEQGRAWVRDQIARSHPPAPNHTPNQVVRQSTRVYGSGEYSLYVKYNRVGNGQDYPAFVFGEYIKYNMPGQIFNPPATQREVYSAWEEEQALRDIESYIQTRLSIGVRTSAQIQTNMQISVADLLRSISPIGVAYAASEVNSCRPDAIKAPTPKWNWNTPLSSGYTLLQPTPACFPTTVTPPVYLSPPAITVSPIDGSSVLLRQGSRDQNSSRAEVDDNIQKMIELQQNNGSQAEISQARKNLLNSIRNNIKNKYAFVDGASDAIGDQIADAIQLAKNLKEARAIYDEAMKNFEIIRDTYYVNGVIQWERMKNDLKGKAGAEYERYERVLTQLPLIIGYLDELDKNYISGYLTADIGLGFINPLKKVNLVTGKKSKGIEMAEDAISRGYKKKDDILVEALIRQPEKRTISNINDFYDKIPDEADQAIDLLKRGELKVLSRNGVEYGFSEGNVKKHTKGSLGYVEGRSYFTYSDGSEMSLDDVYNLQIEGMNKITSEVFDQKMKDGLGFVINMRKNIGYSRDKNNIFQISTNLDFRRDINGNIHAFPTLKPSDL